MIFLIIKTNLKKQSIKLNKLFINNILKTIPKLAKKNKKIKTISLIILN